MIYLHIGRHKTGTSAIQQFLGSNRERLEEQGLIYPLTEGPAWEHAHHAVWIALSRRTGSVRQLPAPSWPGSIDLQEFAERLRQAPYAVVSSEALQELNPADLVDVFPPDETTVVVYVREQLDYLLSAYSQGIQSSIETRSFMEFLEDGAPDLQYGRFLDAWADAYAREHLIVRIYDRERLKHGNAVDDFMEAIGFRSITGFARTTEEVNVSLSALLTVTKRLLNRVLTTDEHGDWDLYSVFERLAKIDTSSQRRVSVGPSTRRVLRERYRGDNDYVSRRYFGAMQNVFRYLPVHERDLPFARSAVAVMLDQLGEAAPQAHNLLMRTVADKGIVTELPPDERRLANGIQLLRDLNLHGVL